MDEITLKKHNLTGILRSDRKQVPKDSIAAVGRSIADVIQELAEKDREMQPKNIDATDKGTAGVITKKTDPTKKFDGVGTTIGLGGKNKKDEEVKKIISDTFSSKNILDKFGKEYFADIGIEEKNIFSFIDYCKKFDIKGLYNRGYYLQLAVLFQRESTAFLNSLKE